MKYHIQFLHESIISGELIPACGSDSVHPLDGRLKLSNMIRTAKLQIESLKSVQQYKHFEIHQGNLRHSRIIYTNYKELT